MYDSLFIICNNQQRRDGVSGVLVDLGYTPFENLGDGTNICTSDNGRFYFVKGLSKKPKSAIKISFYRFFKTYNGESNDRLNDFAASFERMVKALGSAFNPPKPQVNIPFQLRELKRGDKK